MSPETEVARSGPRARQETRLRVAYVYRHFSKISSIPSLYRRLGERLSYDLDLTLFCSVRGRERSDAPLAFCDVDPLVEGTGRLSYAIECASFAARAGRAVSRARETFDLVHAEGFAMSRADLVTVHAVRAAEHERYFERIEPRATVRRVLSPYVFQPQAAVVLAIERRLFADPAPFCIAASLQIKRDLERFHGVPPELIEMIPYGIDVHRLRFDESARARKRAELGVPDDRTVLLFVGDSFLRKGLDTAIEGVAASRSRPDLWVIGSDDTSRYAALAARLGIAERIRFLGRRPHAELPDWYSAGDVLLLPSRNDAWGLPPIEAMAAGRIPVVSSFTGCSEAIEHGANGYVLSGAGSAAEIAALLDGPLADPATRTAVGSRAATDAQAFAWPKVYPRILEAHQRAYELRRSRLQAA
jgi:glycosyltransferase involved in cell wall biosynthesis